jgi:hypothetical protein
MQSLLVEAVLEAPKPQAEAVQAVLAVTLLDGLTFLIL